MKQRMGEKARRRVQQVTGRPVRSVWHRGGRNPRYYDVFFGNDDDTWGDVGFFFPDTEELQMSEMGWKRLDRPVQLELPFDGVINVTLPVVDSATPTE